MIRGREAVVDGEPLCAKHEVAGAVARAGYPVMRLLCHRKNRRTKEVMLCPHFDGCPYLAQFRPDAPAVRFFAHEYLWTPSPAGLPRPDLIVIDESFALGGARHASFGIDRLTAVRVGMSLEGEALIRDVAVRVRDLLETGGDPRTTASAEAFAEMADVEGDMTQDEFIWPTLRWEEQKRRAAKLKASERSKVAALWRVLGKEAGRAAPLQRIELRRDEPAARGELQDRVHVWWHAQLRLPLAPILALDASLDERLARKPCPGSRSRPSPPGATPRWSRSSTPRAAATASSPSTAHRTRSSSGRRTGCGTCATSPRSRPPARDGATPPTAASCSSPTRRPRSACSRKGRSRASTSCTSGRCAGSTPTRTTAPSSSPGDSSRPRPRSRPWPVPCSATRTSPSP